MWSKQSQELAPVNQLQVCPYDKNHKVGKNRFMIHMLKCRREYKARQELEGKPIDEFTCKYNFFHQILEPELIYHEAQCEDRKSIRNYQVDHVPFRELFGNGSDGWWSKYDLKQLPQNEQDRKAMYEGLNLGKIDGTGTYGEPITVKQLMSMSVEEMTARERALIAKHSQRDEEGATSEVKAVAREAEEKEEEATSGDKAVAREAEEKEEEEDSDEDWGKDCNGPPFDYNDNIWNRTKRQMHTPIPMGLRKTERKLYLKKFGKQMEEERRLLVAAEAKKQKTGQKERNLPQWRSNYNAPPLYPIMETEGKEEKEEEQPGFRDGDFEYE